MIDRVVQNWEAAYASGYQIQVSADGGTGPMCTARRTVTEALTKSS
nr:hypothetical protein [Paenibacillus sp. PL91]